MEGRIYGDQMEGWIKLHRKMVGWQWAGCPNHLSLFVHLLLRANYRDTFWRGHEIKRGQILTGRKQLAEWTGLTEQQVRTCLDGFKSTKEITIDPRKNFSIITILNFETHQEINQENNQQITNNQPADNQLITTSKNYNKYNNTNKLIIADCFPAEFFDGVIDDPKKILPPVKTKANRKTSEPFKSPLAFLFKPEDEIQGWLAGKGASENVQKELLENYSHHVLAEEIKTAYQWHLEKGPRQAGLFLKTWMKNKPRQAYGEADVLEAANELYRRKFGFAPGDVVESEERQA